MVCEYSRKAQIVSEYKKLFIVMRKKRFSVEDEFPSFVLIIYAYDSLVMLFSSTTLYVYDLNSLNDSETLYALFGLK